MKNETFFFLYGRNRMHTKLRKITSGFKTACIIGPILYQIKSTFLNDVMLTICIMIYMYIAVVSRSIKTCFNEKNDVQNTKQT